VSDNDKSGLFGDEDIFAELDAWDRTFDALHETADGAAGAAPAGGAPSSDTTSAAPVTAAGDAQPTQPPEHAPARADKPTRPPEHALDAVTPPVVEPPVARTRSDKVTPPVDEQPVARTRSDKVTPPIAEQPAARTRSDKVTPPIAEQPVARTRSEKVTPPIAEQPVARTRSEKVTPPIAADRPRTRNDAPTAPPPVAEVVARTKPRTVPPPPPRPSGQRPAVESPFGEGGDDRDETDFSELGVAGEPEALGSLLGTPPPLAPPPEEAELRPAAAAPSRTFGADDAPTRILPLKPLRQAHTLNRPAAGAPAPAPADDDDAVLTSAARPAIRLESGPTDDELFGDLPAQPVPVVPALRPGAEATRVADLAALSAAFDDGGSFAGDTRTGQGRPGASATRVVDPSVAALAEARRPDAGEVRGPAIVRRHDLEQRRKRQEFEEESSGGGDFSSGDSTRVADLGEIEQMAQRQREESAAASAAAAAFFAEKSGAEVELRGDEDFYDDIEIGGNAEDAETGNTPLPGGKRLGQNVVRRPAGAIVGPAASAPDGDDDELSIAISHDEPGLTGEVAAVAPAREVGEDDFSDLGGDQVTPVPAPMPRAESAPVRAAAAPVSRPQPPTPPAARASAAAPPAAPAMRPLATAGDDDEDEDSADWWDDDDEGGPPPAARTGTLPVPPPSAGGRPSTIPPPFARPPSGPIATSAEDALDALDGLDALDAADAAPAPDAAPAVDASPALDAAPAAVAPPTSTGAIPVIPPLPPLAARSGTGPLPAIPPAPSAAAPIPAGPRTLIGVAPFRAPGEATGPVAAPVAPAATAAPAGLPVVALAPIVPDASVVAPEPVPEPVLAPPSAPVAIPAEAAVVPSAPIPVAIAAPPSAPIPVVARPALDVAPELPPSRFAEPDLALDLDAVALPERVDPTSGIDLGEAAAQTVIVYERELATIDDPAALAAMRAEAGRLSERLGDLDRARAHYEAALLADPRSTQALRGLRRLARNAGDLAEATQHLDAELALAGPMERRALALHRVDLLMAAGEQDLARVAVGELLDGAPSDVRALLAQLELAFLDGRADEFGDSLDRLASALADPALRGAVQVARGHLDERSGGDPDRAARSFEAACESDPDSVGGRLGLARAAAGRGDVAGYVHARVELATRVGAGDPISGAAIALRAAHRAAGATSAGAAQNELEATAVATAAGLVRDELVLRAVVASAERRGDAETVGAAARELAAVAHAPADRAAAAVRAAGHHLAGGDAAGAMVLYQLAGELDAGDDHSAALLDGLLDAHGDRAGAALALARRLAADPGALRDRVRLARLVAAIEPTEGATAPIDAALGILDEGRAASPGAPLLLDTEAELLAAAGRWRERAERMAAIAALDSPDVDPELANLRAALAFDLAARAAEAAPGDGGDELARARAAALEAWTKVLDFDGEAGRAHGAALALATRLGDRDVLADVLVRAQAATRSPAAATTLALARARAYAAGPAPDLGRADEVLREANAGLPADDPRRTLMLVSLAGRTKRWGDAALALEDRAEVAARVEADSLRFRAAQIHLERGDDPARAAQLLGELTAAHPGFAPAAELLGAARRRLGDAAASAPVGPRPAADSQGNDAFARMVREADLAAAHGDAAAAVLLYTKALELRPGDPLAADPLARVAAHAGEASPVAALALAELRRAEEAQDARGRADAYEALARVDADLRRDPASALISWEAAAAAAPDRQVVLARLARAYAAEGRWAELLRVRDRELAAFDAGAAEPSSGKDAVAIAFERALDVERDGRPDDELRVALEDVVRREPRARLPLFHLEALVRRAGSSPELARLELAVADLYGDDPRAHAAFLTRAAETLTDLGQLELAIAKLRLADAARPGGIPTLQTWRWAALKGSLWVDFAEAATREADATHDGSRKAALHHLAGVAYMDKALVGDRAGQALRKAIAADPRHTDAFVRLRMLLDEQGDYEDLAQLLDARVDVEAEPRARIELHRASAELHRNFLGDRDTAKRHYRAILAIDAADLRAIAALSDICWEQGAWAECAEALMNRARLERESETLRAIYRRLGTIYADRIPDPQHAIKAFQRVLSYDQDDREALERLADLGIATAEWRMALGACERLVKSETDPAKKVTHLHRVGRIFTAGFNDRKKAERAYIMALDAAPESDLALTELVRFYQDAGDVLSVRVHLNRVAGAMRARVASDPRDGVAYRVVARAMAAREGANVRGSLAVARAAAELARLTGGGEAAEDALVLATPPTAAIAGLARPEADELLFPRTVQPELRQILTLLSGHIAKHVGIDLRPYGVTRGDRLRAKDSPVAAAAQEIAERLGLGEIDVYLSARQPLVMVAEPTSPVSLVLGQQLAADPAQVRFAAGAALKLAQAQLAIPARLPPDELGVLVVALLRLFVNELPYVAVDADAVAAQVQKLRRLIPSSLMTELKPYALGLNLVGFDHRVLARGLAMAGWRAGVVASGSVVAGLRVLAARLGAADPIAALADPDVRELALFAIGDDHAGLAAM
jgi:tetratricopeptide (TPR) repeat protein